MTKRQDITTAAITGLSDTIKRVKEQQALLRAKRPAIAALVKRMKRKPFKSLGLQPFVSHNREYSDERKVTEDLISIGVVINSLPGFKDRRLVELLGEFMDADKEQSRDWPAGLNRDFIFWFRQPEERTWIKVCFYVYVRSDSPTCRKVLTRVETETVEKPIYEIVCD